MLPSTRGSSSAVERLLAKEKAAGSNPVSRSKFFPKNNFLLTTIYIYVYYTCMPNKTIYVSEKDASLFEQAKDIAGEALSSVIVRALSEFVARNIDKTKGMKEVTLQVGLGEAKREQRFVGSWVGEWSGFSDDKQWWLNATIYRTQKDNWAVYLVTVCKASLLTDRKAWKESGDYLINSDKAELFVSGDKEELMIELPEVLAVTLENFIEKYTTPVEYLDI